LINAHVEWETREKCLGKVLPNICIYMEISKESENVLENCGCDNFSHMWAKQSTQIVEM